MQPLRKRLPVVVSKLDKGAASQRGQMGAGRGGVVVVVGMVVVEELVVAVAKVVVGSGGGSLNGREGGGEC